MITDKQIEAAALVVFTATVGRAEEYLKAKGQKRRKDFDRLIRRALEAAEAAAWQPIETAPRDGTFIQLFLPAVPGWRRIVTGWWESDRWAKSPRPYWTNELEHVRGKVATRELQPTHWRPLPPPPEPAP